MATKGYLGIDAGTQGLSVIFTNEDLNVLATGEGSYDMVPGLDEGCYEQNPGDWEAALRGAMADLRAQLGRQGVEMDVAAIGISAQMHGEVLADAAGNALGPARLWCDSRNDAEGAELTERFGVKMPKRITAARWLWTLRNRPDVAVRVAHITTPAGWISYRLTGEWTLGIGDAAGMFPIDQATLDYDAQRLESFDALVADSGTPPLGELLPSVRKAGESAGTLSTMGNELLGLPAGIPVAPAEGDQPAALAGSLIGEAGMVSMSYGTSVCANSVGDRAFEGVSAAIDHFCAADGKPINMVWIRNGTTFMNTVVEMFGLALGGDRSAGFSAVMPQLLEAADDCGGILALPFMDDEPGLGVQRGGTALVVGLAADNATPGNVAKAALLATTFNLRLGSEVLDAQGFPRTEIILSGGLTKTPRLGQIIADVFRTPVVILESGEEGTAWGAALMAKYRAECLAGQTSDWASFLERHASGDATRFEPNAASADVYDRVFERYRKLMQAHGQLDAAVAR
ncbi:MAG: FGGY-family carbohydrate kinase [Planctomycetales bacterium]|nr:FGGY-family carbohydrate kinase [Planctomycetales bacterium]